LLVFKKCLFARVDSSARIGDVVHVGFCRRLMGQSRRNEEGESRTSYRVPAAVKGGWDCATAGEYMPFGSNWGELVSSAQAPTGAANPRRHAQGYVVLHPNWTVKPRCKSRSMAKDRAQV
jgi:hypothetical protein